MLSESDIAGFENVIREVLQIAPCSVKLSREQTVVSKAIVDLQHCFSFQRRMKVLGVDQGTKLLSILKQAFLERPALLLLLLAQEQPNINSS